MSAWPAPAAPAGAAPAAAPKLRPPVPTRRPSARARYAAALDAADECRAELAEASVDGASVPELARILKRLAQLEAAVSVADRRNGLAVRIAHAATRVVR